MLEVFDYFPAERAFSGVLLAALLPEESTAVERVYYFS